MHSDIDRELNITGAELRADNVGCQVPLSLSMFIEACPP